MFLFSEFSTTCKINFTLYKSLNIFSFSAKKYILCAKVDCTLYCYGRIMNINLTSCNLWVSMRSKPFIFSFVFLHLLFLVLLVLLFPSISFFSFSSIHTFIVPLMRCGPSISISLRSVGSLSANEPYQSGMCGWMGKRIANLLYMKRWMVRCMNDYISVKCNKL